MFPVEPPRMVVDRASHSLLLRGDIRAREGDNGTVILLS